jgi:tRNA 2-thiouridine synthesizing protein A
MRELEQPATAKAIIREIAQQRDARCPDCSTPLGSHQLLMNIALGFKDAPRCVACLATALDRDVQDFRDYLVSYLQQRDCYRVAWAWADREEGMQPIPAATNAPLQFLETEAGVPNHAAEWDAGDMGCGELVLELRLRLQTMQAGQIMKLCARDPGAPEDLPAWCRLTGHILSRAEHPNYWIKRKE